MNNLSLAHILLYPNCTAETGREGDAAIAPTRMISPYDIVQQSAGMCLPR
ncbi:MAG: hypothetical protein OJF49_002570 [Ktedonobacterales bacterium]|nr:MAG: hypothetical protein OJF49_002570 [Ktedonobacterales bacterium]